MSFNLNLDLNLYDLLSEEIDRAILFNQDIERPLAVVRDRLKAFLSGERRGEVRKTQKKTIARMKKADFEELIKILKNAFTSEAKGQYKDFTKVDILIAAEAVTPDHADQVINEIAISQIKEKFSKEERIRLILEYLKTPEGMSATREDIDEMCRLSSISYSDLCLKNDHIPTFLGAKGQIFIDFFAA